MNAIDKQIQRDLKMQEDDRKLTTTFKLEPDLLRAIEREAKRLNVSKGAVVRAALRLALGLENRD